MKHHIKICLISLFWITGCASTGTVTEPLTLEIGADQAIWTQAIEHYNARNLSYHINTEFETHTPGVFNRIEKQGNVTGICLSPVVKYREDGEIASMIPARCAQLDTEHPERSLR